MAFGARNIAPIDLKPRYAVGVNLPLSGNSVFIPNYTTREATKNNLINFFLTNKGERPLNPNFGANLRQILFEQITNRTLDGVEELISEQIRQNFPNVVIEDLIVNGNADYNTILVTITYNVSNTDITDTINLEFA
jgi:phage baseplate assembly protein W